VRGGSENCRRTGAIIDGVDLREYLLDVATGYDRRAGLSAPAQLTLRRAPELLAEHAPGGIHIIGSGGKGFATLTPWIGFLDPDETTSPRDGVYVVYLFSEDLYSVTLTLNQGIERIRESLGDAVARVRIADDARAIRGALADDLLLGLDADLSLGSEGQRQRAYEAGNIGAIRYEIGELPDEQELQADLARMMDVYQHAVGAKRNLLLATPGAIASPSVLQLSEGEDTLKNFKPKDDSDYLSTIQGKVLIKTRRHETLVRQYGEWVRAHAFEVSTREHPKDLVLRKHGLEWLVEAKGVYQGKAAHAVRAAIGQLFEYRHFLPPTSPHLVALFSESVGQAYVAFLEGLEVASIWKSPMGWSGSQQAFASGLAEESRSSD
jgi:MrcB-like, N-terminal domain